MNEYRILLDFDICTLIPLMFAYHNNKLNLNQSLFLNNLFLVESMPGIIRGTSLLNLGVRLSPHPASDVLSLRFCSCACNRGNSRESLQDYFSSSWRDFHQCDAGEPVPRQ